MAEQSQSGGLQPSGTGAPEFGPDRHMALLLIEDSLLDARLVQESIHDNQFGAYIDVNHVETLAAGIEALAEREYDCILLDLGLPDGRGPVNVQRLRELPTDITIVVMTGDDSDESGLQAIHYGAQEYLIKGQIAGDALIRILRHSMERNRLLQELQALRRREYFLATHDPLTGLPNRQLFEDRAEQVLARAQRNKEQVAICYLDLDGFKPVNDSYGHALGDKLLSRVGERLVEVVRDSDTVARIGGDEFVVLLYPLDSREQASRIAERIIAQVSSISAVEDHPVRVSTSVGISIYPEHGSDLKALTHHADIAMYRSKTRARGGFEFFSEDMLGEVQDRRKLISEINNALREARFSADFQPWLDIDSGNIQGFEALLRWHSKEGDHRHPRLFLAVAEETGQILKIARSVNEQVLHQWMDWRHADLDPGILGLNLSIRELRDEHYMSELTTLFDRLKAPQQQTQLHIDAFTAAREDMQFLHFSLGWLRELGFQISLDRVTWDNIPLETLLALDLDEVRLDASVVAGIKGSVNNNAQSPIEDLMALSEQRGFRVVPVGVETQAQADRFRELGCTWMQGLLFAPPVSADAVPALLRH